MTKKYTIEDLLKDDEALSTDELILWCLKDLWANIETDPGTGENRRKTAQIWNSRIVKRLKRVKGIPEGELL